VEITMTDARNYGLLSETSTVEETRDPKKQRHLPVSTVFSWLGAGWRDLWHDPLPSLGYGVLVTGLSAGLIYAMFALGWDYVLFPALSGFMIVAPVIAIGLYEKSRILEAGGKTSLDRMLVADARSGAQVIFAGLLLMLLTLVWMRAAVLLYALFFGYRAFPGFDQMLALLLTTPLGWGLLVTGTIVGGLFAALAFAISAFSIPMLLNERTDAITAMAVSLALVWNNLWVMIAWGAVVMVLVGVALATALIGLIIVFPLLGHATWHAYKAIR
jgi:uncharacterized membrane protein